MNKLKYCFFTVVFFLFSHLVNAQSGAISNKPEPNDFMRSNGKIYVVVAVIVIILSGLFLYLYNLDKKITSLEKSTRKSA